MQAADTKAPVELGRYLRGLASEEFALEGSAPVRLTVSFPRPRLSVLSRETEAERERGWVRTLGELPVRHAVLRLAGGPAGAVRVADVPDPSPAPGFERFLSAAVAGNGQSAREAGEALAWRRDQVERVAGSDKAAVAGGTDFEAYLSAKGDRRTKNGTALAGEGRTSQRRDAERGRIAPALTTPVGTVAEDGSVA